MSSSLQDVSIRVGVADVTSLKEAFRIVRQIWAMALPAKEQLDSLIATGLSLEGKKLTKQQRKSLTEMVKSYEDFFKEMATVWGQMDDVEHERLTSMSAIVDASVEKIRIAIEELETTMLNLREEVGIKHIRETLEAVRELKQNLIGEPEKEEERGPGRPMPRIKQWLQEYYKEAIASLRKEGINIEKAEITGVKGVTLFKNIERKINDAFNSYVKVELEAMNQKLDNWMASFKEKTKKVRLEEIKDILSAVSQIRDAIREISEDPEEFSKAMASIHEMIKGVDFKALMESMKGINSKEIVAGITEEVKKFLPDAFSQEEMSKRLKLGSIKPHVMKLIMETEKSVKAYMQEVLMEFLSEIRKTGGITITEAKGEGGVLEPVKVPPSDAAVFASASLEMFKEIREKLDSMEKADKAMEEMIGEIIDCCSDVREMVGEMEFPSSSDEVADKEAEMPTAIAEIPDDLKALPAKIDGMKTEILDNIKVLARKKVTKKMLEEEIKQLPVTEITRVRKDIISPAVGESAEMVKVLKAVEEMKTRVREDILGIKGDIKGVGGKLEEVGRKVEEEGEIPRSTTKMTKTRSRRR